MLINTTRLNNGIYLHSAAVFDTPSLQIFPSLPRLGIADFRYIAFDSVFGSISSNSQFGFEFAEFFDRPEVGFFEEFAFQIPWHQIRFHFQTALFWQVHEVW
jgi:hypothetical protein